ncbi:class I SAM-dependent methyltransferase [Candidatus Woesearchaeota archaeon]|nr:MAG: class I SAM-dependent methyltransferase [Candidatus Woesearchaeota archaeon]
MGILSNWLRKKRTRITFPYVEGSVLDIGCGPASILEACKDKIDSYVGFEYDESLVKQLNSKFPYARFFQKDLEEDKFELDCKFDRILLVAVIEHIFNQKRLIEECLSYLKPEGKIVITTPTVFGNDVVHRLGSTLGLFKKDTEHIVIYNKNRFRILACKFNLRIEEYRKFELGCNQLVVLSRNQA